MEAPVTSWKIEDKEPGAKWIKLTTALAENNFKIPDDIALGFAIALLCKFVDHEPTRQNFSYILERTMQQLHKDKQSLPEASGEAQTIKGG